MVGTQAGADRSRGAGRSVRPPRRWVDGLLLACLAGWIVMALYLFLLVPSAAELTDGFSPELGHALIFAALGATATAWLRPQRRSQVGRLLALGAVGGIAVELAQASFTSSRSSQLGDVVADVVGLGVGIAAVAAARRVVRRPEVVEVATGIGSAALLIVLTAVVAITPARIGAWWECRSVGDPGDRPLLVVDPDEVRVRADRAGTDRLAAELAERSTVGGYRFDGEGSAGIDSAPALGCPLRRAGAFRIEASLVDVAPGQRGPARIVTLSRSHNPPDIDLHLGVEGDGLSVRVRTSPHTLHQVVVPGVVRDRQMDVVVTYGGSTLEVQSGGRTVHAEPLEVDPSSWRHDQPLTLGDEHTGDRALRGTLTGLVVYATPAPPDGGAG